MKVRSITYFCEPGWPPEARRFDEAARVLERTEAALEAAGFEVQTMRLALPPFASYLPLGSSEAAAEAARSLLAAIANKPIAYLSIGPALADQPRAWAVLPEVLAVGENLFASISLTDKVRGISVAALRAAARLIQRIAHLRADGFANLRLAALAGVAPGSPFFPAAYHAGGPPALALATEAADLAVQAFEHAPDLDAAGRRLTQAIERTARALTETVTKSEALRGVQFAGIDFSLAPFPSEAASIGAAFERLGVPGVGLAGSALAAALITQSIDRAEFARTGFCGLMLPIFEDAVLARHAGEGALDVSDLLLYCTMCGTGLDTIPLPGDIPASSIESILLDLAAVALRHAKPLTARLMPLPAKRAGDLVQFDFAYFAPSRVMQVKAEPPRGLLAAAEWIAVAPHSSHV
jgi:uncharacterized protein